MPEIGEVRRGREIGKSISQRNEAFIWHACLDCGKEGWIGARMGESISQRCKLCADKDRGLKSRRENNPQWRGGIRHRGDGYISISLTPDDPYYAMTHKRDHYVYGHRLIMAKFLGRCLESTELVHHRNGDKTDNRIENLELISSRSKHMSEHIEGFISGYQKGLADGYEKGYKDAMDQFANKSEITEMAEISIGIK